MRLSAFIAITVAFVVAFFPHAARAEERITGFMVEITVEKDGDIEVVERLSVISEGRQIQRGVFRDLPRTYLKGARTLPYRYAVKSVTRDGQKEPYAIEEDGNAYRIRIGSADVYLDSGPHDYVIAYAVKNQVRYFDGYDEIYWNATGNYWAFPITRAQARVKLPGGAGALQTAGYTGAMGVTDRNFTYRHVGDTHVFETTAPLAPGEGMTLAVGFAKGVVDPPSAADARSDWWAENLAFVILGAAASLIALFYAFVWNRIGRDPAKGPVFARYEPPAGFSPAATHYVFFRGLVGHRAFIATLVNLGVLRRIEIDVEKNRKTVLRPTAIGPNEGLSPIDVALEGRLLAGGAFTFGDKYSPALTSAYEAFKAGLKQAYGAPYFRWNRGFLMVAGALSVIAFIAATNTAIVWTDYHSIGVAVLVLLTLAASYFLPAPTPKGQDARTEIEGFRLYLKTAEQLQLNSVEVGSDAPPPMSVQRYERFLPYAIALDVEKPWTEHFEKMMPTEAAAYDPYWARGNYSNSGSLAGIGSALVSTLSSGVSTSLPQSSSSSGSGGGGSSGGGGGGGGGGGW